MPTETRIETLAKLIDTLTAEVNKLKTGNDELQNQVEELKTTNTRVVKPIKLPARDPPTFKRGHVDFRSYAVNLECYMKIMSVPQSEQAKVLLTYLDADSFRSVTRIHTIETLSEGSFQDAVDKMASVLSDQMSEAAAANKLMRLTQGKQTMLSFITQIERYGDLAFPKKSHKDSKEFCMTSALISGCRSRLLGFEIAMMKKKTQPSPWSSIALKAQELDAWLNNGDETGESSQPITINRVGATNNKRCYGCREKGHVIANCLKRYDEHEVNSRITGNEDKDPQEESQSAETYEDAKEQIMIAPTCQW